ncbi:hypothetical protein MJO28_005061 [Puccinia striiformis f. sp. tritici]|uniref:MICOS complex subunit n=3 Tax=Puccinia striiformis TaxID=27350 RepID=A0A0L0VCG5_9BASI|nr:hypothetical protein Pst134EA_009192 [Puccinia striiformis f. sp. tritici]KAI9617733.1 hypothetical protein KEM48_007036 [Puccinia striiformis f. sp. tritici PST-130]KNE96977.1 hypothetical protein PSTG_09712 [Puccinia striiformis f. sp. tritici PST-78]POW11747.1 hypothetical protein PSTT_05050 [Puccinia striiformis]KAH9457987.1 hypothetical protein Pst134EB_010288 [Puccinia striiformis f. sp. tritici]KAH9458001.1 hypothetical protein Pst134EB_010305 [Puccinia striiformis f. sp. tritici]
MATESSTDSQASYPSPRQLPIYDEPSPEIILVKTELPLQPQVRWARQNIQSLREDVENRFNFVLDHGLNIEKKVVGTLGGLIDRKEASSSSVLCVGIGTMTGSILARNRSFPLRFLSPLTFLILSSNQFLPTTTHNFKSYIFKLQDQHFPRSAASRDELIKQGTQSLQWLDQLKQKMFLKTTEVVKDGSQVFEKYSGLNISHASSSSSTGKNKTD